jgi:predicted Zn-ribbon and HTH transcriptional regulator
MGFLLLWVDSMDECLNCGYVRQPEDEHILLSPLECPCCGVEYGVKPYKKIAPFYYKGKKCLNCGYERTFEDDQIVFSTECPKCLAIYEIVEGRLINEEREREMVRRERERKEHEQVTARNRIIDEKYRERKAAELAQQQPSKEKMGWIQRLMKNMAIRSTTKKRTRQFQNLLAENSDSDPLQILKNYIFGFEALGGPQMTFAKDSSNWYELCSQLVMITVFSELAYDPTIGTRQDAELIQEVFNKEMAGWMMKIKQFT